MLFRSKVEAEVLKPDANTNIIWQRTLIPTINLDIKPLSYGTSAWFATGVFAMGRRSGDFKSYEQQNIGAKWRDVPVVYAEDEEEEMEQEYIRL